MQSQAWLYMSVTPALENEDGWILGVGWLDLSVKIMSFRFEDNLSQKKVRRRIIKEAGSFMCTYGQAHLNTHMLI